MSNPPIKRRPSHSEGCKYIEVPLAGYTYDMPNKLQSTLTIVTSDVAGVILGAALYEGDEHLGTYYAQQNDRYSWEYNQLAGKPPPAAAVLRLASLQLSNFLGRRQRVCHAIRPPVIPTHHSHD